jgi:hypothetical protein
MKALMHAPRRRLIGPVCGLTALCLWAAGAPPSMAQPMRTWVIGAERAQAPQLEPDERDGGTPGEERLAPRIGPERDAPSEDGTTDGPEISPNEMEREPPSGCTFQKRPLELLV